MINMARDGTLDILVGLVPNRERSEFMEFSKPFFRDYVYAFVHRNANIDITRAEELTAYKRVEIRGHSLGSDLDKLLGVSTDIVNNENQLISIILAERADYFIDTQSEFDQFLQEHPGADNIKQLPVPVAILEGAFGISKASPCGKYLGELNRIITQSYPLD
jgi:ABC-type amino acid transport substrate-binding protein